MKKSELKQIIKYALFEDVGYSKFTNNGKTDGLTKDTLDKILLKIANGGMDDSQDQLDEGPQPKVVFSIYEHIINKLNGGSFEDQYPTASSFFHDIKHIIE